LLRESARADTEILVWVAKLELLEEDITEVLVVVLSSVNQRLLAEQIEALDDQAQADDFGPRAEKREDLQLLDLRRIRRTASYGTSV
jgi:hypothetical protein